MPRRSQPSPSFGGNARCGTLILLVGVITRGAAASRNFIYIVSDDLRAELPPLHPDVHAPALARLAREGLSFDRAYCNQPVWSVGTVGTHPAPHFA